MSDGVEVGVQIDRITSGLNHDPVVYFVRIGDHVKIGVSANLAARMQSFYLSLRDVLLVVPGDRRTEDAYHDRFRALQVGDGRRELFRLEGALREFLDLPTTKTGSVSRAPERALDQQIPSSLITLNEAVLAGMLPGTWTDIHSAFGTLKNRAKKGGRLVPQVKGKKGTAAMYDAVELADFLERETAGR